MPINPDRFEPAKGSLVGLSPAPGDRLALATYHTLENNLKFWMSMGFTEDLVIGIQREHTDE